MVTQMPFSKDGGGITTGFAKLGERGLFVADADLCVPTEGAENADSLGVAAGHEGGPRRGAYGGGGMKIGEYTAFAGHTVEVGRFVSRGAERADIGVSHVVDK